MKFNSSMILTILTTGFGGVVVGTLLFDNLIFVAAMFFVAAGIGVMTNRRKIINDNRVLYLQRREAEVEYELQMNVKLNEEIRVSTAKLISTLKQKLKKEDLDMRIEKTLHFQFLKAYKELFKSAERERERHSEKQYH